MKQTLTEKVSSGIKFLGDIPGFELPNGVLNKGITGCGATTVALTDPYSTIICSPRNELLRNKSDQYPNSLLVIGGVNVDEIINYINKTPIPKILVSYDSFPKLLECISDKSKFRVVVDEFHFILQDASFKSEVGLALLNKLKVFPYVTYLSATPILDKFIDKIDFFKDIPYTKLDWEDKELIEVVRIKSPNPISAAIRIVENYKNGDYPKILLPTGEWVESTECVIFLNSVNNNVNIVKPCRLSPEDVNLIVGASEDNDKQISKIGEGFSRGRIPLKGEKHKKFTFCTSTAYAGCDFYSESASTFVISDNKRLNTSIDISTDLVQIAGRQRLETNPFRKHIYFIYNTSIAETNDEQFYEYINTKVETTQQEIESNNNASTELKKLRIANNKRLQTIQRYSETYTLYNEDQGIFVLNELAYLNEIYSYEVQKHNYQNGSIVYKQLKDAGFDVKDPQIWKVFDDKIDQIISKVRFEDKMKEYCELIEDNNTSSITIAQKIAKSNPNLKSYHELLGGQRIKALGYKEANLKKEINNFRKFNQCYDIISRNLKINEFISAKEAKKIIAEAYTQLGITVSPKGSDLSRWFDISGENERINGKMTRGYIVALKRE